MARRMAYELAEQLNFKFNLNRNKDPTGGDRLSCFCKDTISSHDLFDKPGNIFNMDETVWQLNKLQQVIAAKGSKTVANVTSAEKAEAFSVVV
ncbi:hypothetical protein Trydic_g1106 [Trypoxylus dichotomus]